MLVFFYISNLVLPKLQLTLLEDGSLLESSDFKWVDFEVSLDWFIGIAKICCCTIPFEVLQGFGAVRKCLLSVLSILLCVNLMQALLVSSFFSVLIFTFARMCRVVAQFVFHYFLLLLGFSGAFRLLFHGLGPHIGFLSSMRVVFLVTFGELNYSQNSHFANALNARNLVGFVLLVLYVVVVTIVALNLMTALMTSEYEEVRSQAEECALLKLAGALHRYEKWLERGIVKQLYESPWGVKLLQNCVRRIRVLVQSSLVEV
uniref:Polycystin cation channel PKD1/PKD2 domain-containing protein n=1 Tax=Globisporangium ultimum (strain ATCC 200006 / CBS 805.95 / DAOM BR144) TaxID=431595 RepID=K3WH65_GLOUD